MWHTKSRRNVIRDTNLAPRQADVPPFEQARSFCLRLWRTGNTPRNKQKGRREAALYVLRTRTRTTVESLVEILRWIVARLDPLKTGLHPSLCGLDRHILVSGLIDGRCNDVAGGLNDLGW
jgi:hypothetical protein